MRVLFTSIRNPSHFWPLLPFIEACRAAGDSVAVATPAELAEHVHKVGAEHLVQAHPGDAGLRPIWARLAGLSNEAANAAVVGEIFAGACTASALPTMLRAIETWKPDVVVRESQEYAGLIAAHKLGVAHARVDITQRAGTEGSLVHAGPALDAHRRGLGQALDPTCATIQSEPALTSFPASMERPTSLPSETARRFAPQPSPRTALPNWWPGHDAPLVYVTMGTVAGSMEAARAAYQLAIDAASQLEARVLLTTGNNFPFESLGPLPNHVHAERFVPQSDVLREATAVVCHGGSGTVLGALGAGVPLVVTPLFADQPDNAERVQAIGAGVHVNPHTADVSTLVAAIEDVLQQARYRERAQQIAQEMAAQVPLRDAPHVLRSIASP